MSTVVINNYDALYGDTSGEGASIVSGILPPNNPTIGQLWIDESVDHFRKPSCF